MDQSLWQTLGTFDLIHSSHMWIQTILSCGKYSTTMQIRIISGLWFCRRSRRLEINIRWTLVHFEKSHVRANKLDVQETDFSFRQLYRSWNISLDAGLRMDGIPALDLLDLVIEVFHSSPQQLNYTKDQVPHQTSTLKTKPRFLPSTTILIWVMLTTSRRTRKFIDLLRCCTILRITKPWLKWSSKAEVQQWGMYPEPTELLLIGCLKELIWTPRFKSSMSSRNTNLQTYWQKGISHAMSGTFFFICLTSATSAYSAALRISAWPAAPQRWRNGCKNRKERPGSWQSQSRRRWTWPSLSRQVLRLCRIRFRWKARRYPEHPVERTDWSKYRKTWRERAQSRRSVESSRVAKKTQFWM